MKKNKERTCFFCGSRRKIEIAPINWVCEETGDDITILKPVCEKCREVEEFSTDEKFYEMYLKQHSGYVEIDSRNCDDCHRSDKMISIYPADGIHQNINEPTIIVCCNCQPHRAVMEIESLKIQMNPGYFK